MLSVPGECHSFSLISVPTVAPIDVGAYPVSQTSVNVTWGEVPKEYRNGNITGYIVFYRVKARLSDPYKSHATSKLSVLLNGLKRFTVYVCRVLAYISAGNGIASREVVVSTMQGSKCKCHILNLFAMLNSAVLSSIPHFSTRFSRKSGVNYSSNGEPQPLTRSLGT